MNLSLTSYKLWKEKFASIISLFSPCISFPSLPSSCSSLSLRPGGLCADGAVGTGEAQELPQGVLQLPPKESHRAIPALRMDSN